MPSIISDKQQKLIKILKEMFQFDQADLDFGIYRIMSMKRDEVQKFLDTDLPNQINQSLKELSSSKNDEELKKLDEKIKQAKLAFADDIDMLTSAVAKFEAQKKALQADSVDLSAIESDIYSHLTNFFSRYYDEGDFISQRRHKDGAYAIPYEGEEVKLHWANADQYYIKTSENFKDYTFKHNDKIVHFKLIEASTEQNNNKESKKRLFQLFDEKPFEIIDNALYIYMEYKDGDKSQKAYIEQILEKCTAELNANQEFRGFASLLNDKCAELQKQLNKYTARNSFDYFIHKDLGKFLNRELDYYIKTDVIFLDDIDTDNEQKTIAYLTKAKIIKQIAKKLITFLAQIEDFQKKLWLKKKFVVESNYCVTLDNVPEELYAEIIENKAQHDEWIKLFAINEIEGIMDEVGYTNPLTKEFLLNNPYLVLDTAFFSYDFKERLLASINDLDERTDGLLIHSENFQALNLLQEKYKEQVKCVIIDPPYNTEEDRQQGKFIYKDNFEHSTWASLLYDRTLLAYNFLTTNAIHFTTIDDNELYNLKPIYDSIFGKENFKTNIIWNSRKSKQNDIDISLSHNYVLTYGKNKTKHDFYGETLIEAEFSNPDNDVKGKWKTSPLDAPGVRERTSFFAIKNPNTDVEYLPPKGRHWTLFEEDVEEYVSSGQIYFGLNGRGRPQWKRYWNEVLEDSKTIGTIWDEVDTATEGTKSLRDIMGTQKFETPKPVSLFEKILNQATKNNESAIDYFAGSGSTGHAVINLNRQDNGKRKYILVEMGEYFDTVTKPRIQKVIYSDEWKNGKPTSRKGSSHIMKYLRLESYEDTLNNIILRRDGFSDLFTLPFSDEYVLEYMLNFEAKDSLFNINNFKNPHSYQLAITQKHECKMKNIDLIETFNYLIGLYVEQNFETQGYDAEFVTGEHGAISAEIRKGSTYKIKAIEGKNLDNEKILVIWREMTGDTIKDNAVLDAFFTKKKISTTDFEYDKIYVNGDNNLPNIRSDSESWKVILIEEEFKKKMFEV